MMIIILIAKIVFLFVSIWLTIVNTARFIGKNDIPGANFIYQAIGITGFLTLMFLI